MKRAKRTTETPEESEIRLASNRARKAVAQAQETPQKTAARRASNLARTTSARDHETPQKTAARRASNLARTKTARSQETPQKTAARRASDLARTTTARAQETPPNTAARLATIRLQSLNRRRATLFAHTATTRLKARNALKIAEGSQLVQYFNTGPLQEDGKPQKVCAYCRALKFKSEPPRTCCSGGKIKLAPFPDPPTLLKQLWEGDDERSRVLKKHARALNNALALACLKTNTPPTPGGNNNALSFFN